MKFCSMKHHLTAIPVHSNSPKIIFFIDMAPSFLLWRIKQVIVLLRQLGKRIIVYLDDLLIMVQTQEMAKCHAKTTINLLRKSGVLCKLPEVSSNTFNNNRISETSRRLKNLDFISSKGEDKESQESFPASIHFRYLQINKNNALSTCQDYSEILTLSQHAKEELIWCRDNLEAS